MTAGPPNFDPIATLLDLAGADTTSGQEDRGLEPLVAHLRGLGAAVEFQKVEPGRTNVLATWGRPDVLFTTHLDTVPPYIAPSLEGGLLRGRGACDAKGQIVAQLAAITRLLGAGESRLAFLGVVGEETDALGAARASAFAPRLAETKLLVNGEPTDLKLATGQRGYLHVRLRARGVAAHSGMPERGRSAILLLLDWVEALRKRPIPIDRDLGPEVWNLGTIGGGRAANIVPDEAVADILVRSLPGTDFLAALAGTAPGDCWFEPLLSEEAARYPRLDGYEYATMPFGSDLPTLARYAPGAAVALVGPGSIAVAHTEDEHIAIDDLRKGADLLVRLASSELSKQSK